ncbi:MAG: AraC family transcriptional regulator [Sphingobacteriaceae bacterium]|nr:MAG: AraC family transcriptional regulator [Sphingobacteriaceae bacterium]
MNITITSADEGEFRLQLRYPKEFTGEGQLCERSVTEEAQWGSLQVEDSWFEGACLLKSTLQVNQHCRLNLHCDSFCWLMNFITEGDIKATVNNISQPMQLGAWQYNTFYCPSLTALVEASKPVQMLSVCLTHRFVKKLLWKYNATPADDLQQQDNATLVIDNSPISYKIKSILGEIFEPSKQNYTRRIYLEAKVLELLFLILETNRDKPYLPKANALTDQDTQKLHAARVLIEENIRRPFSITELSRQSRLNDFKLKKGFKQLFGNTVFGYLNDLRMEKATNLLKQGNIAISEIADTVGYKNAHHFTAAFKKKTGLLPSDIRKEKASG